MRILITAGPTREAIDPVRYISNRSSGKMGYAIARAALSVGHEVILISGPVNLDSVEGTDFHLIESAHDMYRAVEREIGKCDAAIFCAAVADYRVAEVAKEKIKKTGDLLTLTLEKTGDILGSCRSEFEFRGILMGFAAETENLQHNAREKLERKGCDFLVANDVSRKDIGFDQDKNEVIVFAADGSSTPMPIAEKCVIGEKLIQLIEKAHKDR